MDPRVGAPVRTAFADVPDPASALRDQLLDLVTIAVLAILCGADTWGDTALIGGRKEAWLRTFLALPRGVPPHDTLGRVFAVLDPAAFERGFLAWVQATVRATTWQALAVYENPALGAHDPTAGKRPLHLVSGWAAENGAARSGRWRPRRNERARGDPGLAVGDGDPWLHCRRRFDAVSTAIAHHPRSAGRLRAGGEGQSPGLGGGDRGTLRRRARSQRGRLLAVVRSQWAIESSLHWVLDLAFRDDESRVRNGHAAENLAVVRHIAHNLLRRETTATVGIARPMAGWDTACLLTVLGM